MDMDWCLACNKQFVNKQFAYASYCSIECMSREDLPALSPAPHAVNSRLRARLEGPSPIGWSRKVREPRSRSMSRVRRPSNAPRAPPVIQLGFQADDRAPSPESEVAWSLPAAGATRLVGSRWMGKDYEGIKCWAHGVRGYPDDDLSDEDDDSDVFEVKAATHPIFPIALQAPSYARSPSRRRQTSSTQLSITPKHHMSVFTLDDTASLATPVTDNCLVQGYVESYQSSNTPPNQAAQRLRRFMAGSVPQPAPAAPKLTKERAISKPLPSMSPKSLTSEPVWIASNQTALRPDSQHGRDWGGLYDTECEKEQLASDRIGSYIPPDSWQRGRTRQRAHTDHLLHR